MFNFKYRALVVVVLGLSTAQAFPLQRLNTLADVMNPPFYLKRKEPILNLGMIYYGNEKTESDLIRIQALLEKRFFSATNSMIRLNTVFTIRLPYKTSIADHPEYKVANITDPTRLQRIWYYDHVNAGVMKEVYEQTKKSPDLLRQLGQLDSIAALTGAQFDGLGFADGRVAITESPREIAWALPDGGRTEEPSDANIVDELIHEIGHTLFLDHAASQCFAPEMTYAQSEACCALSPAKDDVMSYCRKRAKVDDEFFYGFKDCNLRILKDRVIPAMLKGGAWKIQNREKCL